MERTAYKSIMRMMLPLLTLGTAFTSCNTVYDDTDDCDTNLRVKFTYDYNMKFADAFANEVKSVRLFAYDESGKLVLDKKEAVSGNGYVMAVDELKPETNYKFVVWAEGEPRNDNSYTFGTTDKQENLTMTINTADENGTKVLEKDITPLFHDLDVTGKTISFKRQFGTTQTATVPLIKNTNNIKIVLQEKDPKREMKKEDFSVTITDDNARMNYDNTLLSGGDITYRPWSQTAGSVTADDNTTNATTTVSALISEFTVGRLVKEGHSPKLTVFNDKGEKVLSIPIIDYILLVKGNYHKDMSDQEYLDREDTYNMTFFLEDGKWVSSSIIINGWHVVNQDTDIDTTK